jgi:hypothetical protein
MDETHFDETKMDEDAKHLDENAEAWKGKTLG